MRCRNHFHAKAASGEETIIECFLEDGHEKEEGQEQHKGWMAVHWTAGHVHDESLPMPDSPGGP